MLAYYFKEMLFYSVSHLHPEAAHVLVVAREAANLPLFRRRLLLEGTLLIQGAQVLDGGQNDLRLGAEVGCVGNGGTVATLLLMCWGGVQAGLVQGDELAHRHVQGLRLRTMLAEG
jgi:hypothetical protein